jgi:hypothetical protein
MKSENGFLVRCLLAIALSLLPGSAIAQTPAPPETRAEVLQRAREDKRQSATPYEPNALERGMRTAEERLTRVLGVPDGFHPKLGSLATGSGFAFGAGYRNRQLFDREGALTAWAAGSLKRYWATEVRFDMPSLAADRLTLGVRARAQAMRRYRRSRPNCPTFWAGSRSGRKSTSPGSSR